MVVARQPAHDLGPFPEGPSKSLVNCITCSVMLPPAPPPPLPQKKKIMELVVFYCSEYKIIMHVKSAKQARYSMNLAYKHMINIGSIKQNDVSTSCSFQILYHGYIAPERAMSVCVGHASCVTVSQPSTHTWQEKFDNKICNVLSCVRWKS